MEFAIYYDASYPAPWLKRHAKVLAEYLEQRGFSKLAAEELASWMSQKIRDKTAHESSVVFCQDAVPASVFPPEVDCANVLLRRYLDAGGRIVWLGDTPLWYRAEPDKLDSTSAEAYGVPLAILGTVTLVADSSSRCEWVGMLKHHMKSRWYSMRPAAIKDVRNFQGLKITPLAYAEVTLLPSSYNVLMISRWTKAGKKVAQVSGQIGVSGLGIGGGISLTEKFPEELGVDKPLKLACAWHVRFNENHPTQGFYRFLDTQIDEIDSAIFEDIEQLAKLDRTIER